MKKLNTLAAILMFSSTITSFANTKIDTKPSLTKDPISPALCYVKMKDGSVRTYHSLTLEKGLFVSPHLLANGVEKLSAKDIVEYKTHDLLAVSQSLLKGCQKSNVSTETLPGFAKLVLSGPVNVYMRKMSNGTVTVDQYFIQSGNGSIQAYTPSLMRDMLGNNATALEAFERNSTASNLYFQLKETLTVLNNTSLTAKK